MAKHDQKKKDEVQVKLPAPRLKKIYREKAMAKLREKFKYRSVMETPIPTKIVVNMGTGSDEKAVDNAMRDMATITGQKAQVRLAKKSVSNFKIREGMKIGCRVTLRGDRMWHFLDRLCTVALPRIRDFQGFSPKSFDGRGNVTIGLKEQLIFTEIDYDTFDKIRGMDVTIVTSAKTDEEGAFLLKELGFPLHDQNA